MKIKILFFGEILEQMKRSQLELENISSTNEVISYLNLNFPFFKNYQYSVAVNKKIIHQNTLLKSEDTIAILPPFAGG